MSKVAITGATGFLGLNLAKMLVCAHEVIAFGRDEKKGEILESFGTKFYKVDLSQKDILDDVIKGCEYVFACAAKSSLWGDMAEFYEANVTGTKNVIDACIKNSIKRLIYVSSPSIYFDFKDGLDIKESHPPTKNPANFYIKTKIMAEELIQNAYKNGLDVITIRPRGIFGVGDTSLLPRILRAKKFFPKLVKDDILVDITHVKNVAHAMILAMQAPNGCAGKAYNITNDEPVQFYKLLKELFASFDTNTRFLPLNYKFADFIARFLEFLHAKFLKSEPVFTRYSIGLLYFDTTLDISSAKKDLGYTPIISIRQGLDEIVLDFKQKAFKDG